MNRLRIIVLVLLSLVTVPAFAQRATIFQIPTGGYVGFVTLPNGQTVALTEVTVLKIPGPTPTPPPITVGKRRVILIKESSEETSAISDMYVLLRKTNGEVNKYLTSKGHLLDILDPQNTKQKWLDALKAKGLASGMVIADFDSSAVLAVVEFPKTLADFMSALKANGG